MKKDEIIQLISNEILWCRENLLSSELLSSDYREGFIKGLIQARTLIERYSQKLNETIPERDDYRKEGKVGLKDLEVIIKCPHVDEDKPMSVYRVFTVGNMWIWLCRACWGEVVVEVKEWFAEMKVRIK